MSEKNNTCSEVMTVRSVRLPSELWLKLHKTLVRINRHRRNPVTISTLIRTVLEQSLQNPNDLPAIGARIFRPASEREQQETPGIGTPVCLSVNGEPTRSGQEAFVPDSVLDALPEVQQRFMKFIMDSGITCSFFLRTIKWDRTTALNFFYDNVLPGGEEDAKFIPRIEQWMIDNA